MTRARTPVERDYQGAPAWAHALEMPTRFAKQLVQLARGGLLLGMGREAALAVAARCCRDTLPPLRRVVLADVAANPDSYTADVAGRPDSPLHRRPHAPGATATRPAESGAHDYGSRVRWLYSVAPDTDKDALARCVLDP